MKHSSAPALRFRVFARDRPYSGVHADDSELWLFRSPESVRLLLFRKTDMPWGDLFPFSVLTERAADQRNQRRGTDLAALSHFKKSISYQRVFHSRTQLLYRPGDLFFSNDRRRRE